MSKVLKNIETYLENKKDELLIENNNYSNLSIEEIVRLMKGNIKRGVSVRESDEIIQKKQGEEPISEKSIYYDLRFEIQSPKRGKKNRLVFLQFDVEFQSTMPTTYKRRPLEFPNPLLSLLSAVCFA